ncbi:threonine synthase [Comamonas sp. JC664]|uniref:threonine synthase n=1 Tax=Comamonas sp. JC664 TaxID=2801917 RepID=UPI00174C54C6|nr:threonine synthase [Comamonas sp. JC664]MBL0692184.1 threonine synthase [Comamonas sp. JC664]GHG99813.1 threonine synthase [Comamonas sp. KCTC 72670]
MSNGTSSDFRAEFACSEGCDFRASLLDVVYRCPRCGGLLEVAHDVAALRTVPAAEWKRRFETRFGSARLPEGSGVWGKREWAYPQLPTEDIVSLGEGRVPLKPLPRMAAELGLAALDLKECGVSPTGSFKDWGMTVLVSAVKHMRARGVPLRAVACASTGDTSAALSAYCAAAGIPAVVFLPRDKVSLAQLVQPIANGARVLSLDTDFDGCMKLVQAVTADTGLYLANSMNSLRIEGQKMVAVELCQDLGWEPPDWVVIPGGNLGNASALGKGFELMFELGLISRRPRIAVAQAQKANPLARSFRGGLQELVPLQAEPTLASAIQIGNPVSFKRAVKVLKAFDGVVEDASESELANAAARADREGTFTCPHTGVALAALEKLVARGVIARGAKVVVVSTAHGLKFADFKVGYHRGALAGVVSQFANPPVELPATLEAVKGALADLG